MLSDNDVGINQTLHEHKLESAIVWTLNTFRKLMSKTFLNNTLLMVFNYYGCCGRLLYLNYTFLFLDINKNFNADFKKKK